MVGARPHFRVRFGRGAGWLGAGAPGAGVALVRLKVRWPAQSPVPQHPPPASLVCLQLGMFQKARQSKGKSKARQGAGAGSAYDGVTSIGRS